MSKNYARLTLKYKLLIIIFVALIVPSAVLSFLIWSQQDEIRDAIYAHRFTQLQARIAEDETELLGGVISVLNAVHASSVLDEICGNVDRKVPVSNPRYLSVGYVKGKKLCLIAGAPVAQPIVDAITTVPQGDEMQVLDVSTAAGGQAIAAMKSAKSSDAGDEWTAFVIMDAVRARKTTIAHLNASVDSWVLLDGSNRVLGFLGQSGEKAAKTGKIPSGWTGFTIHSTEDGPRISEDAKNSSSTDAMVLRAYFPEFGSIADSRIRFLAYVAIACLLFGALLAVGLGMLITRYVLGRVEKIVGIVDGIFPLGDDEDRAGDHKDVDEIQGLERKLMHLRTSLLDYQQQICRDEDRLVGQVDILRKVAKRASLDETLASLCRFIEHQTTNSRCSVLILDRRGRAVCKSIAPNLPDFYSEALIGLQIGPTVGSCGAAMATASPVFVNDIETHPNWAPFRGLALPCGLRACWSLPVIRKDGRVLAAFAIYKLAPGDPTQEEIRIAEMGVELALLAIDLAETQELLARQALNDELTTLPNRRYLFDWLARNVDAFPEATENMRAVLVLDLDDFKPVNDTYGHAAGDIVLKEVAERLLRMFRPLDVVSRTGGDEFAIVLNDIRSDTWESDLCRLCKRLTYAVSKPITVGDGATVTVNCSIGISIFPTDAGTSNELLHRADEAMYAAKASGKNRWVFWKDITDEAAQEQAIKGRRRVRA
ncbi:diguanylate cyclase domain-containing protein [Brucella anthropi]|uniref:diguanylate cyclase domain-containing protein n=1 Tax=Brucella anthropi TaxID=529 RepID=UPI003987E9FE